MADDGGRLFSVIDRRMENAIRVTERRRPLSLLLLCEAHKTWTLGRNLYRPNLAFPFVTDPIFERVIGDALRVQTDVPHMSFNGFANRLYSLPIALISF